MQNLKYGSTFTGIGGFELGIKSVFPGAKCSYYSEFDKFANDTYLKHFDHEQINVGDIERAVFDTTKKNQLVVNKYRVKKIFPKVDLLVGGPPCQDLSIAKGKRLGLAGPKSRLFYAFLAIKNITNPKNFLMENVATMSHKNRDMISELLGVDAVEICVDRFTPQKRRRLYWFDWDFDIDLLPEKGERWPNLVAWSSSNDYDGNGNHLKKRQRETRDGRANTLTTGPNCGSYSSKNYIEMLDGTLELLTPSQCEQLQGLPVDWTLGVSDSQRFKQIGNSVNPDTVRAILLQHPLNKQLGFDL